ncbi:MAG TPA: M64 family metallopeptidase, partial [Thermoanaerobaculia bacterium]|nr:M64 family metallopeptidase [Thermoanaerobaculia bacterium]
ASRSAEEAGALLSAAPRGEERLLLEVTEGGRVTYRDVVDVPKYLRGEFAGPNGEIESHLVEASPRSFVARIPSDAGRRLSIRRGATVEPDLTVDLGVLASRDWSLSRFAPASTVRPITTSGSPANRLDILIMGDGYQAAEQTKFNTDATNLVANFFNLTPYKEYAPFVNTSTLFTASTQSGADHPPYSAGCAGGYPPTCCADVDAQSDPLAGGAGTFVNTAFDGSFCTYNIQRLLTVDGSKINVVASDVPNWDKIFVLVNDTTYGGSGGAFATASTHSLSVNVAQHEFGHSFSLLADEYTSPYPGFPSCSDITSPPCEPNVTNQTVRASIKWNPWIAMATPVPTPDTAPYFGVVGLFQGARYSTTAYYRPKHDCLMNHLAVPFCEICRQAYVLRLYNGGWGAPAAGIDNIEPGSESPTPGMLSRTFPGSQTFMATLLAPTTPALTVSWWVDGVVVPGANAASYMYTFTSTGTHTVELRTHDGTTFANAAMAGTALDSSRLWTLNITCATDAQAPAVTPPASVTAVQTICQ